MRYIDIYIQILHANITYIFYGVGTDECDGHHVQLLVRLHLPEIARGFVRRLRQHRRRCKSADALQNERATITMGTRARAQAHSGVADKRYNPTVRSRSHHVAKLAQRDRDRDRETERQRQRQRHRKTQRVRVRTM